MNLKDLIGFIPKRMLTENYKEKTPYKEKSKDKKKKRDWSQERSRKRGEYEQ